MLLRKDDPWVESLPIPDIRNWRVVDEKDARLGFVETLVVDPQEGVFEALYTGANDRFVAESVEVADGVVRVRTAVVRNRSRSPSTRSKHVRFDQVFQEHFARHYSDDYEIARLLPAYQFGREASGDPDFSGRSFLDGEEDLKARFRLNFDMNYADAREAIKFAYELVHDQRGYAYSGVMRDDEQEFNPSSSNTNAGSAIRRSGYMSTVDPDIDSR